MTPSGSIVFTWRLREPAGTKFELFGGRFEEVKCNSILNFSILNESKYALFAVLTNDIPVYFKNPIISGFPLLDPPSR